MDKQAITGLTKTDNSMRIQKHLRKGKSSNKKSRLRAEALTARVIPAVVKEMKMWQLRQPRQQLFRLTKKDGGSVGILGSKKIGWMEIGMQLYISKHD